MHVDHRNAVHSTVDTQAYRAIIVRRRIIAVLWYLSHRKSLCFRQPTASASEGIVSVLFRATFRSSCRISLPRYLMNGLNSFYKTVREYSLARTDERIYSNLEVKR